MSGPSRLQRELFVAMRELPDAQSLLENVAKLLTSTFEADPSIELSLDILAYVAETHDIDSSAIVELRDSYGKARADTDERSLAAFGRHPEAEGDCHLACGDLELPVQKKMMMRLKREHSGFFSMLDRLPKPSYKYDAPIVRVNQQEELGLLSMDCQMSPVVLRCLVALHYRQEIPDKVWKIYANQVTAVVGWLYPGMPLAALQSKAN